MKLSDWAKKNGISYQTAWNWFKAGKLPVKHKQTATGTILVYPENDESANQKDEKKCVIYCRVSTPDRKKSLEDQAERCMRFAEVRGFSVDKTFKEIASGMNDSRPKLLKMLELKPKYILIENKDRLTRFGFNYINLFVRQYGGELIVINNSENDEQDLMKDFISVITSFCSRLYGIRRAQNKVNKIKEVLTNDSSN